MAPGTTSTNDSRVTPIVHWTNANIDTDIDTNTDFNTDTQSHTSTNTLMQALTLIYINQEGK